MKFAYSSFFTRRRFGILILLIGAVCLFTRRPAPPIQEATASGARGAAAVEQLKKDGSYNSLAAAMNAARHHVQPGANRHWLASNPAQQFEATFNGADVRIAQTLSAKAKWQFGLKLTGYGYGQSLEAIAEGEVTGNGNRVEIRKSQISNPEFEITEWYTNKPEGLEQGFTLPTPPPSRISNSQSQNPLRLRLQLSGELRAETYAKGQAAILKDGDGRGVLSYDHLAAWDANHKALPATMTAGGDTITLEVDDAGAVYPVTIDPLIAQQAKLTAADGADGEHFGHAVALHGAAAVIGAPDDVVNGSAGQGSAYVFSYNGTTWNQQQKLTAVAGGINHYFGSSVALESGTILIGAPSAAGVFNFTIKATDANGCMGTRAYAVTINGNVVNNGLRFYPLPRPLRLLDTRAGQLGCDAPGAQIPGGTSRTQPARRTCDGITIPANALAVTGNITTVQSGGGYLTLYPSNAQQPLVANSNYAPNEVINNVFTVGLGNADGSFKIFVTTNTDVVVDITGYYAPPAAGGLYFHPLPKPIRLLETRAGFSGAFTPGAKLQANADTPQQARVTFDGVTIPTSALAIVGNATTLNGGGGYMTLYPGGVARPLAASSNFAAGQVMNAPFTVGLSATGEFNIFTTTSLDMVVDVLGYYSTDATDANGAGLLFNPLAAPVRLLETRAGFTGCFVPGAPLPAGSTRNQQGRGACGGQTIANNALAIVGNATVVNNQAGYLTFWPNGAAQPLVASSNFAGGQVLNRHFTVGLGANGMFNIFASAQTDLIVDVSGFFAP